MKQFLEIEPEFYNYDRSKFVVIPCPHEVSTSYGKGTKHGPAAILKAAQQVETFDEDLGYEPYRQAWIYTENPTKVQNLKVKIQKLMREPKIPVILVGEHSITPFAVETLAEKYKKLTVLQLDAHADLRDVYKGKRDSHACVMRRVLEICPAVQAGICSISAGGWAG